MLHILHDLKLPIKLLHLALKVRYLNLKLLLLLLQCSLLPLHCFLLCLQHSNPRDIVFGPTCLHCITAGMWDFLMCSVIIHPKFSYSSLSPLRLHPLPAASTPAPPPAAHPIPVQPVALLQPYIRTWPPLPMQVDPANVPLPTPSTDSSMSPPDQPMPASPRTCTSVEHL